MGWIASLFFIIYYFVSREPVSLMAAALFSISGAISFVDLTLQKIYKIYEKKNSNPINGLFETFLKHADEKQKNNEQNEERV